MKPEQFKNLRNTRGLTREELGNQLGVSASAIVQWERGTRGIPTWAVEKMLRTVSVTLCLEDLSLLLDYCTTHHLNFSEYMAEVIRKHLATLKEPDLRVADEPPSQWG